MATVKREGDRIITKVVNGQRRVSCSCCAPPPGDCCPYDSRGFQSKFFMEDLPQTLFEKGTNRQFEKQNITDAEAALEVNIYLPVDQEEGAIYWINETTGWANLGAGGLGFCLLVEDPQFQAFTDDFSDNYEVEILFGDSAGTYTVTRRSLCVWSEFFEDDEVGGVKLVAGSLPDGTMIWLVEDSGGDSAKSGTLDSPLGDYGIPTTLAIVSEP